MRKGRIKKIKKDNRSKRKKEGKRESKIENYRKTVSLKRR